MANIGVRIRNGNRQILIDSTYLNQALRSRNTYTISQSTQGYYRQQFSIACSPSAILAFRNDSDLALNSQQQSGNIRTITLISLVPQQFEVYVFDTPELIPASGIGIRIRNNVNGKLIFDSRLKYLKVKNFIPQFPAGGINVSGIRKPAVIPSQAYYEHQEEVFGVGPGGLDILVIDYAGFHKTTSNVVSARITSFFSQVYSGTEIVVAEFVSGGFSLLLIDVEDY